LPEVWKVGAWPGIDTDLYISKAIKHRFVTLGWAGTQSAKGKSERAIASMLKVWDPRYTRVKLRTNARDLWRFVHIPKGDYIVLYHLYKARIGRVTRPYYWVSEKSPERIRIFSGDNYGPHRLGVKWLNKGRPFGVEYPNLARKVLKLGEESIRKFPQLNSVLENDEKIAMPVDIKKPPQKTRSEVTRYVRDTAQSRLLKDEYEDKCQVCGETILKGNGDTYSEAHHLWPLQDKGPDHMSNMLVLCPNHHACFDLRNGSRQGLQDDSTMEG
jgi:hypothetical protein